MTTLVSLTEAGRGLAERICRHWPNAEHWHRPSPFGHQIQTRFIDSRATRRPLVFICATGIVMRTLAPVLTDKYQDPPVLVLDEAGRFVIPLLSGHEGGANALGDELATCLGATLVATSAARYTRPVYTLGMGCERHCDQAHLDALITDCLMQCHLHHQDIAGLASIAVKADEIGLIQSAAHHGWPYHTFSVPELRDVEHLLSQRSDVVFREVGVYGVAEAAALVAATRLTHRPAELVLPKQKTRRATCAIARSYYE
ncbi:cobalamin biosynthesis protein [Larsenimonas rhizosphaerae]|uniref:cobalamin biosynthesis protein n=1 Tax=Larsenimonas rhizosphaerae TaxID=2944682 RepID=UPI002033A4A9|nr:cobalamin biosynthesis protein [Larsenimonas rhizosphaerae]MCM2130477.1 cobalamin biosynthesis protein [Larsenimonas rhizosphaerae]